MAADPIAIGRENIDAFSAGDWGRFRATLTDDCVYTEPATQRSTAGADAAVELSRGWREAFPDAHGTVTNALASGDQLVLEITWEGTQSGELTGPLGSIPASGRRATVQAVQVCRVADGKLAEVRHYFDLMGMLVQIGAVPAPAAAG